MVVVRKVYKQAEYRIYKNEKLGAGSYSKNDVVEMAMGMKKKDSGAQIEIVRHEVIAKVIL